MRKFQEWHSIGETERLLAESKGVMPDRVAAGEILFTDNGGRVWNASSWKFVLRYLPSNHTPSKPTNKKSSAAAAPVENPDYLRAVEDTKLFIGSTTKEKSRGIVTVILKDSDNNPIVVGRMVTKDEEPKNIENSDFSAAGFKRRTKLGGQLQTLTADHFLKGHSDVKAIRINESNVPHFIFSNLESLKSRIITNMKSSSFAVLKEPAVIKATEEFLDGGAVKFDWSKVGGLMNREDRLKFGIYLVSEIAYPFIVWEGSSIGSFPGFSSVTFFAVPTSNTEASYDSYLRGMLRTGGVGNLMVSSKTITGGRGGARSSILPKLNGMARSISAPYSSISNKFLARMLPYFKDSSRGGQTIYPFMVNEVLGLKSVIKDPVDLWRRVCILHGKRSGTLSQDEKKLTEMEVLAIQSKVKNGVPLVGISKTAPITHNAAAFMNKAQWVQFSKYLSDIFCDAIAVGLNHDTSDLRPSISWQINLNNGTFVETGEAHFTVRQATQETTSIIIDNGKQSAGDPSRNITWLGTRPLK